MLLKMLKSMVRNTGAPRGDGEPFIAFITPVDAPISAPGQRYVNERFAPARIAGLWARVLEG